MTVLSFASQLALWERNSVIETKTMIAIVRTFVGTRRPAGQCREVHRVAQVVGLLFCTFNLHSQSLVAHGDVWRYRKERSAPSAGWKTADDSVLDASWLSDRGGFGYADNTAETSFCQTLLSDMSGGYSTLAMRKSFQITTAPDPALHLSLTMDFDDGFIAWLDGVYLMS